MENRTADIIQDTKNRRLNVRKKDAPDLKQQPIDVKYAKEPSKLQNQTSLGAHTDMEIQLQASRDVRWPLFNHWSFSKISILMALVSSVIPDFS